MLFLGGVPLALGRAMLVTMSGARERALVAQRDSTICDGIFLGGFECSSHCLEDGRRLDLAESTRHVRFAVEETLTSRVMHDVHQATAIIYSGLIVAALDAAQLLLAFALLLAISPKLTLACIGFLPAYGLVFGLMNGRVRDASERLEAHFAKMAGRLTEVLAGQALIKACTAERREAERFRDETALQHRLVVEQSHVGHLVAGYGELLVNAGTTTVIGYGSWLALRGELSPGMLLRFLGYVVILYGPVRRLAELNMSYQSSLSALRRVLSLLTTRPAITDAEHPRREPPAWGHVRFEDVSFSYGDESHSRGDAGRPPQVLSRVSLEAQPGERVAVVGASGAGKTTLLSLLPRLYDVAGGRIVVDGCDVREYSIEALRTSIAVVQQDTFIFSGSVSENIAYGRPGATEDQIREAASQAFADEFIERLPGRYSTLLGERGINLSGGQRQRVSIARALLRDPRILILDEATSALDAESERRVQAALERLTRGRTCFIIAHRLSTIKNADRILVLHEGRLVEAGRHDSLMRKGAFYAKRVHSQLTE
jgi:subfamily B ATP-binding cassette protein MsbA